MVNIKKIIREEVSNFDWVNDLPDTMADYLITQLSDDDKSRGPYFIRQLLQKKGYSEKDIMDTLAKHYQPRERFKHEYDVDTTYWTTDNASSTYQFNYPPKENSLTKKFTDWVKSNPGGTKVEFYDEVLNLKYRNGHQAQFFQSILNSGIVKVKKGRNGVYKYFIGPNFEHWTKGKLKRYMGINVPYRYN